MGRKLNGGFNSPHAPKKKLKKGLDKTPNLWYNKYVSKRENKSPANKRLAVAKRHENLATTFRVATDAKATKSRRKGLIP